MAYHLKYLKNDLFEGVMGKKELQILTENQLVDRKGCVLIAIHDPTSYEFSEQITENYDDVLQLKFWDVNDYGFKQYPPISEEQGNVISSFIRKHKDKKFMITCHAGMCRSAGVAMAVECIVKRNSNIYEYKTSHSDIKAHERYYPNLKVFDTVMGDSATEYKLGY